MRTDWKLYPTQIRHVSLLSGEINLDLPHNNSEDIAVSEIYDLILFRKILKWRGKEHNITNGFLLQLCLSTTLSAGIISFYAIGISHLQGPTTHFMLLFFLFAALFAAMNNHHLRLVLVIRLIVYGVTFIFIPARGIDVSFPIWTWQNPKALSQVKTR